MDNYSLILASNSPRRAELLSQLQVRFTKHPVDIDETPFQNESAISLVKRLSLTKARVGFKQADVNLPTLGSDTVVVYAGHILGKPRDFDDSKRMLSLLSGNTHQVLTSVAVVTNDNAVEKTVITDVTFKSLSEKEIAWYWQTGEPQDKAGSYGIQGLAGQFVTEIRGSYSAVVGLPLYETRQLLNEVGVGFCER
ncbi:Maf-like protein [Aestuariibacter sp. AA17]|uniref:dTTP/UTP pyrophosphatase n=1 Tax=Fluctibacter corallii TaxID=2984329 RepID=A0ABT3ABX5_9ALTE|nr:Maf family protein [Aestuariibacter sp. AA17]MCV2885772.1 Maf-like protein [Aestuariibacter sp. AA17]